MLTWYSIVPLPGILTLSVDAFAPKLLRSIKLREWAQSLWWGCHILCMKFRKNFLSPGTNLFVIKIYCGDISIHSFNWWILELIYYDSVLLLSNKGYGTRLHPKFQVAQCLVPEYLNLCFFQTGTPHIV